MPSGNHRGHAADPASASIPSESYACWSSNRNLRRSSELSERYLALGGLRIRPRQPWALAARYISTRA